MYSLTSGPNARVYKLSFVNSHARQNSIAVRVKAAVGLGGLLLEVGGAGGGGNSLIFRMVIKADAGISNFGYPAAMDPRNPQKQLLTNPRNSLHLKGRNEIQYGVQELEEAAL